MSFRGLGSRRRGHGRGKVIQIEKQDDIKSSFPQSISSLSKPIEQFEEKFESSLALSSAGDIDERYQVIPTSPRLASGTIGVPIKLISNFYTINVENKIIYHYDITIKVKRRNDNGDMNSDNDHKSDKFLKRFASIIVRHWAELNRDGLFNNIAYIYDGWKNIFTTKPIPHQNVQTINEFELDLDNDNRPRIFLIKIQPANRIDKFEKNLKTIIQVFEVLIKNICEQKFEPFQRRYFDVNGKSIQHGIREFYELVSGFACAVRPTEFGLGLNLHLKTAVCISSKCEKLEHFIYEYFKCRPNELSINMIQQLNRLIRHLKIFTVHHQSKNLKKIVYTVEKIENLTPDKKTISSTDGTKISIADYFRDKYQIEVRLDYPLVRMTGNRDIYIPLELCYLRDKQFISDKKLNDDFSFQRERLHFSTHNPEIYFKRVNQYVNNISNQDVRLAKEFGVNFSTEPTRLVGRVLQEPRKLNMNPKDRFYNVPNHQLEWVLFSFDRQTTVEMLKKFGAQLTQDGKKYGLNFKEAKTYQVIQNVTGVETIINVLKNISLNCSPLHIALFVIPQNGNRVLTSDQFYGIIKTFSDRAQTLKQNEGGFGLITQCINSKHVLKMLPRGYMDNISLKINAKVGGLNNLVDPQEIAQRLTKVDRNRTMVVGLDVCHPGFQDSSGCSVAAAVGSYDSNFSRYTASIRIQRGERDEIITDLDMMIEEMICEYQKTNGFVPDNLIIFRDGVSEGQFHFIKLNELPLILDSGRKFNPQMKIVLLVVQKRHHTRFLSEIGGHGPRRNSYNVPSGTVVDNSIVDSNFDSFYLNSHFSPLGTSKPTKYVLLRNDLRLNADELQQMCFFLCHNCVRYRGIIAIPTPVRYADLCAYRSKQHIETQYKIKSSMAEIGNTQIDPAKWIERLNEWVKIHAELQNSLYYC